MATSYFVDNLPYQKILEDSYEVILGELLALHASQFTLWPEVRFAKTSLKTRARACLKTKPQTDLYKTGWKVFGLIAFGARVENNCCHCPKTLEVLDKITATTGLRISTAGFSCLAPGVHIIPHTGYRGYSERIYRVHLGLVVPAVGDLALRVGAETRHWRAGGVLAFDDLALHEAWNATGDNRIVLLLDVERAPGTLDEFSPTYTEELRAMLKDVRDEPTTSKLEASPVVVVEQQTIIQHL